MREVLEKSPSEDVFSRLSELYSAGVRFANENPLLVAVGQNLMREEKELRQELMGGSMNRAEDFIEGMLKEGVRKGQIDSGANLSVAASMIATYNLRLVDSLLHDGSFEEEAEDFLALIEDMIYILKKGLVKD